MLLELIYGNKKSHHADSNKVPQITCFIYLFLGCFWHHIVRNKQQSIILQIHMNITREQTLPVNEGKDISAQALLQCKQFLEMYFIVLLCFR